MNAFAKFKIKEPFVFNPKVTPDPTETERLEAKLREAAQLLTQRFEHAQRRARRLPPTPA